MPLNKSKSNMYDWITKTWNPIGGECPHKCSYCYVKHSRARKKYTGTPYLVEHELKRSLGKGHFWFVGSMIDMFAEAIPRTWISRILDHCLEHTGNKYLFQTKNPGRIVGMVDWISMPSDCVIGTTIETNRTYEQMGYAPDVATRAISMSALCNRFETMVTVEPIMNFDMYDLVELIEICKPQWVNIGADSKNNGLPEPNVKRISILIQLLEEDGIEVKIKPNLKRLL